MCHLCPDFAEILKQNLKVETKEPEFLLFHSRKCHQVTNVVRAINIFNVRSSFNQGVYGSCWNNNYYAFSEMSWPDPACTAAEHPKIRQNTSVPPNAPFVICIQQTHKLNDSWVKTPIMTSGVFFPLTDKLELLDVGKRTACKLKPECRVSANKDGWGHTWIQHLSESRADVTSGSKLSSEQCWVLIVSERPSPLQLLTSCLYFMMLCSKQSEVCLFNLMIPLLWISNKHDLLFTG